MSEPVVSSRRTLLAGTLTASAFGGLLAGTGSGAAQAIPSDPTSLFFLAIPGIPGDSTDDRHPDTIELLDWSYGVDNTISPTNTGSGTSKSKPRDFVFVSRMGVASPKLFAATAKGTHFASAQLFARRAATEGTFDYLVVKFENLFVTSYAVAPSDTDAWPMDVVHMDYGRITVTFRPRPVAPGPGHRRPRLHPQQGGLTAHPTLSPRRCRWGRSRSRRGCAGSVGVVPPGRRGARGSSGRTSTASRPPSPRRT